MNNSIEGKVIAVTGASSGIGKAIAQQLAQLGAKLALGARRTEELQQITSGIEAAGGKAVYLSMDVRRKADLQKLVDTAVREFGRLDVIINNAGIAQLSRVDELDVDGWDEMIDINLKGVLYGMAAAIPVFKKQQSGHIVNIISTAGLKIVPTQAVYAGSKNAVRTIAEAFRQESDGTIRITGISPGMVRTDFSTKMKTASDQAVLIEKMQQIAIAPEAIAGAVIYAISQPADVEVGDIVIRPAKQN